jgi:hypothetical protein
MRVVPHHNHDPTCGEHAPRGPEVPGLRTPSVAAETGPGDVRRTIILTGRPACPMDLREIPTMAGPKKPCDVQIVNELARYKFFVLTSKFESETPYLIMENVREGMNVKRAAFKDEKTAKLCLDVMRDEFAQRKLKELVALFGGNPVNRDGGSVSVNGHGPTASMGINQGAYPQSQDDGEHIPY